MSYATAEGKRLWAQRYRESKRRHRLCLECRQSAVASGLCNLHLQAHRTRCRRWQQIHRGHTPRQPWCFISEWQPTWWEEIGGVIVRVLPDFRDPLTVLLEREAQGEWRWRAA